MGKFFLENRETRECFDALPVEVRNKIIESDLEINSKDELELVAKGSKIFPNSHFLLTDAAHSCKMGVRYILHRFYNRISIVL